MAALVTIGSQWHGSFTAGAGTAASAWNVNFCGSVTGWTAAAGLLLILAAVLVFIGALIQSAVRWSHTPSGSDPPKNWG